MPLFNSSLFLTIFFCVLPAFAQESVSLPVVEIAEDKEDAMVKAVSGEELQMRQAEDLEDIFRSTPEVVVGGGQRAAQKVYVRGLEDTNLNITIDGARQSGQLFHHQGRLNIEPELLKTVVLDAGTGNALSGPGALGGRISFVTKDVEDLLHPGRSFGAFVKGSYNSNADEKGLSLATYGKASDRVGILFYGTLSKGIDYRAGGGERVAYTGASPKSALAKVTLRPTISQKLSLSAIRREDNARRLLRAEFGVGAGNSPRDQIFETDTYALNYDFVPESKWIDLHADVYLNKGYIRFTDEASVSDARAESMGAAVRNTLRLERLEVSLGTDWNQDKTTSTRAAGSHGEKGDVLGLYTQLAYTLHPGWRVMGGARFDEYELKSINGGALKQNHISPNIGTRFALTNDLSLFASWAQAFKGPTPIEAFVISNAQGFESGDDLKGTVAETSQIGAQFERGSFTTEVVGYTTLLLHPLISGVERSGARLAYRRNTSDIRLSGVNLGARYKWARWSTGLSYSLNDIQADDDATGFKGVGDRLTAQLEHEWPDQALRVGWSTLIAFKLSDAPAGQLKQPGYNIHDFTIAYNPAESLRLGVTIHNIFDTNYVAHGTRYFAPGGFASILEPGRDVRLSASYLF